MFQPTQSLMFRRITSLGYLRIHPPLPLTPRESTQLLNLLTTSFRHQLDREHGASRSEASANGKLAPKSHHRHSPPRPDTDRHLHSILTNPLFKGVKKKLDTKSQSLRDPMEIFDDAWAKGFMKVEYARECLKAKKLKVLQSPVISVRADMKLSGAGLKVLRWVFSSSVANQNLFLQDEAFSEILVEFLVAEGLQSVVWTWLETMSLKFLSAGTKPAAASHAKDTARLLYHLVKAETSGFVSLDTGYSSLGKAADMLVRLQCEYVPVLQQAGRYLYRETVLLFVSRRAPSPEMFDLFLSIVPKFAQRNHITISRLQLYHPTKPDTNLALEYLRMAKALVSTVSDPESQREILRRKNHHDGPMIQLGLDTAWHLFERDQQTKAQWVMNFLQETYGKQLGSEPIMRRFKQAPAEAPSLELFKSLKLA